MELEVVPSAETDVVAAVLRAAAAAGIDRADDGRGPWWRLGVEESLRRGSADPRRSWFYEVAPSPRSTRGATRA